MRGWPSLYSSRLFRWSSGFRPLPTYRKAHLLNACRRGFWRAIARWHEWGRAIDLDFWDEYRDRYGIEEARGRMLTIALKSRDWRALGKDKLIRRITQLN